MNRKNTYSLINISVKDSVRSLFSCFLFYAMCKCKDTETKRVRVMVFNTTFNNIFATAQRSVLLVEETGVP